VILGKPSGIAERQITSDDAKLKTYPKGQVKKEQLMENKKFLKYGLIISFVLFFVSCKKEEKNFYRKIEKYNDCMVVCTVKYNKEAPIIIVMEKSLIIYKFKKNKEKIDDDIIKKNIETKIPIEVLKKNI